MTVVMVGMGRCGFASIDMSVRVLDVVDPVELVEKVEGVGGMDWLWSKRSRVALAVSRTFCF